MSLRFEIRATDGVADIERKIAQLQTDLLLSKEKQCDLFGARLASDRRATFFKDIWAPMAVASGIDQCARAEVIAWGKLARIGLSVNTYTQWYWKTDLHNLLHFLRLRADSHAQYEIRVYANLLLDIVRRWVPMTYDAFLEYQLNAVTLSATAVEVMRRMLHGEKIGLEGSGLSKREWDELFTTFDLKTLVR
jgi:Thymidylate synthase complementing protein